MYDAIIIGSGPAGYECARFIHELGGTAAIIEKYKIGGCCTNYGCIPTKAMHASATFAQQLKRAKSLGVDVPSYTFNFREIMERKARIAEEMSKGVSYILNQAKADVIQGEAKIKDANTVIVEGKEYQAKNIVIATGAKPRLLPGLEVNSAIMTSTELLELKEKPSSLAIIGGGYIGSEFASIMSSFDIKVTIIEGMARLVSVEDEDTSKKLHSMLQKLGVEIFLNAKFKSVEGGKIAFEHEGQEKNAEADKILVAVGMSPVFNKEELDAVGVKYDKGILVHKNMKTSVPNIYAIGDVTGQIMLAHYAYAQAEVAAKNIMGQKAELDPSVVPSAIFTIPEISSVGIRDGSFPSVKFLFSANGKAQAMDEAEGFIKIYYEGDELKGFSAIGPHASDLVAEAALAIKNKIPLSKIEETIHVHPTLSEAFKGAVQMALKKA